MQGPPDTSFQRNTKVKQMSTPYAAGSGKSSRNAREKHLRYRRDELHRASEYRALLLRGFSHDLKNALGATDGFLELLELGYRGPLAPQQQEAVVCGRRSLRAALGLLQDMFDMVRTAGGLEVNREPTDMRVCLRNVVEENRAGAETRQILMDAQIPAQLPAIDTDAGRVRQIVENLLINALKYTPAGGAVSVRADIRCDDAVSPRTWLIVDVEDNGPGIAPRDQVRAFQEFARFGGDEIPGAGIGLAISQRVATALGGRITLQSEPGFGSTFTLWLPVPAGS
jgi:signal transduction histidine kinase